ncbi:MAG: hypothetical protein DRI73_08675 [Bacteroidetes bacterium]|nr:MAG: hypothetical protein DRI73_08675 [Bacteroidota bacterium]
MLNNVSEFIEDNSIDKINNSSDSLSFYLPILNEIDYKDKLLPYEKKWGLMGIDLWADAFKDPEINAKRKEIEFLEDSIRDGESTATGSGTTTNNHGQTTTNSGF